MTSVASAAEPAVGSGAAAATFLHKGAPAPSEDENTEASNSPASGRTAGRTTSRHSGPRRSSAGEDIHATFNPIVETHEVAAQLSAPTLVPPNTPAEQHLEPRVFDEGSVAKPSGPPTGRPRFAGASTNEAAWKVVFKRLSDAVPGSDAKGVDTARCEEFVALGVQAQVAIEKMVEVCSAMGMDSDVVESTLAGRLFSTVKVRKASKQPGSATRQVQLLIGPDESAGEEEEESEKVRLCANKLTMVMEHRGGHIPNGIAHGSSHAPITSESSSSSQPSQGVGGPPGLSKTPVNRTMRRVQTDSALRCAPSPPEVDKVPLASAGGGLFMCKHMPGPPSQIYDLTMKVGEGTFGTVHKGTHKKTGQEHAIKAVPKKLVPQADVWGEINMMKNLDHPHIMRLYYTFEDKLNIYIASEICAGGELFNALANAEYLSESITAKLLKQCLSAVAYLHCNNICHRDLKPENFLLAKQASLGEAKVKMIDFGTAKRFDLGPMTTKVCTINFVAPEVLKRSMDPYTEKVDIWSCGVMLYMMLCGNAPFSAEDDKGIIKLVKKGKFQFEPVELWAKISSSGKTLISKMMCVSVPERLSAMASIQDVWFEEQADKQGVNIKGSGISGISWDQITGQMRAFLDHNRLKKVALQVIARNLNDDFIEELRELFEAVDTDKSGTLTMSEMDDALETLHAPGTFNIEMKRIMALMDTDSKGEINYTEFIAATVKEQHYLQDSVLRAAFHMLDRDQDGFISKQDCAEVVGSACKVEEIFSEVDENGDGNISFDEFMAMMKDARIGGQEAMAITAETHRKYVGVLSAVEED
mmetsp:Transcript_18980/g.44234  ORF Transcript_18980/g.44234 Transcript_18980/m.44234 type:complete len:813 (+) Transcript_18980:106-2544(+)|eukprot:CAMPEP_0178387322 /NCGR_PEP_ID=MMETSP0689_2-20121128/9014_1 /TAXON_ID=160604 /ORGANISM="Amphidinium massartii, Strain CS-259" /LENGTH=812 /DNA_ID=CAMNT_0020007683 /DNA_START=13 /DNA_END=2451 /DNA_ORIENTATION=-